jgi:hypothetical protein
MYSEGIRLPCSLRQVFSGQQGRRERLRNQTRTMRRAFDINTARSSAFLSPQNRRSSAQCGSLLTNPDFAHHKGRIDWNSSTALAPSIAIGLFGGEPKPAHRNSVSGRSGIRESRNRVSPACVPQTEFGNEDLTLACAAGSRGCGLPARRAPGTAGSPRHSAGEFP